MNQPAKQKIGNVSDLAATRCKQFMVYDVSGLPFSGFMVKCGDSIYAYKNSCPHLQVELNWQVDEFLNFDDSLLICAMHGALFTPEDGVCIQGPCLSQKLQGLTIIISGDEIYLCN